MAPDSFRAADTREWMVRAEDDLGAAADLLALPTPRLRAALFHCQQSVEKALKAFLAWHDRPLERTHDLRRTGRRCAEIDSSLEALVRCGAELTEYAWKFRYPGAAYEPTREEAEGALRAAREVVRAVRERLPAEAQP